MVYSFQTYMGESPKNYKALKNYEWQSFTGKKIQEYHTESSVLLQINSGYSQGCSTGQLHFNWTCSRVSLPSYFLRNSFLN